MIYILILIYIISAFAVWYYMSKAHYHPLGKYKNVTPTSIDIITTLLPVFNTLLLLHVMTWKDEKYKTPNKFFKTKW